MKYKVSNVCQLLDKSKYTSGAGSSGYITFTHDGSGQFTAKIELPAYEGGHPNDIYEIQSISVIQGHKYLVFANLGSASSSTNSRVFNVRLLANANVFGASAYEIYDSMILNCLNTSSDVSVNLQAYVKTRRESVAVSESNTYKPEIFDLTEMYGEGNEPTTVAEFKADYPDAYYEYSPNCWVDIHKLQYKQTSNTYASPSLSGVYTSEGGGKSTFS